MFKKFIYEWIKARVSEGLGFMLSSDIAKREISNFELWKVLWGISETQKNCFTVTSVCPLLMKPSENLSLN